MTNNTHDDDKLLTTDEAAAMLGLSPTTLHTWRCLARYNLPFVKVGRSVRYRVADVREFIRTNTATATA